MESETVLETVTTTISEDAASGTIGSTSVTWTLKNGVLFIGGSGSTPTFASKADQPWATYRDQITQVWFDDMEAVYVADLAYWFTDCVNLETAEIPYTTPVIGTDAFAGCDSLQTVLLYYSESDPLTIADGAFKISELDETAVLTLAVAELHDSIKNHAWLAENHQVVITDVYGISSLSSAICGGCTCIYGSSLSLCANNTYDACYCDESTGTGGSGSGGSSYETYSVTYNLTNVTKASGGSYAYSDTAYTATLTANTGYTLPDSIAVTVGGSTLSTSRYTYSASTGSISIPASRITGNIGITAAGVPSSYTITWNGNGGTTQTTTQNYGETLALPSNPTRTGYTFAGWYTAASGGTQVTSSTVFTGTADTTYYAHWTTNSYTVTWNASTNGGTVNGASSVTTSVPYGSKATAPSYTPVKTGYTFKGWYTTATGSSLYSSVTISGARTFYAQFTANAYTITWALGNGATETTAQIYGETLTLPTTPSRTGYTFDGWYTAETGGVQVTEDTVFTGTGATTYYAHWTPKTYSISYFNEGGEPFDGTQASGYPTTHTYGTATALPDASKEGYYFLGWYTDSTCTERVTSLDATAFTSDITLYAKWELIVVFSVTVPANLSLSVAQDGTVYAGTNAEVVNNSTDAVEVTSLTIQANNGWSLVPYATNMAGEKVDSKKIGFSINGAATTKTGGEEALELSGNWTIQKGSTLPLDYTAKVSATSQPITDANVLTLVFVLDWA